MRFKYTQIVRTDADTIEDSQTELTGDTLIADGNDAVPVVVAANGGSANVRSIEVAAAQLVAMSFLSTVACVVTLTGATVIDGITIGTVTLVANKMRVVTAITGDITSMSVGANTVGSGPAGTIKIRVLKDA